MSLLAALKLPALDTLAKTGAAMVADSRGGGEEDDAPARSSSKAAPAQPAPPSGAPPMGAAPAAGSPAPARAGISAVQLSIPVKVPDKDFSYVTCGGSVTFAVTAKPEGDEPDVEVKIKNLKPEVEAKLKKKFGSAAELSGGLTVSDKEGSVGVGLDLVDAQTQAKTTFEFHVVKVDAEHAKVEFAALEWSQTYPLARTVIEVGGVKWKVEGGAAVKVTAQPNWKQIAADVFKRLGVTVAEDAALGVAAGGTGTAGAAAVAAASSPVIVAAGGIFGGLALTAGAMAWIDALEAAGRDATQACVLGAKKLRDYATSYGSAMRGAPGPNAQGNADAEAALKAIMDKAPGTTREQAIDAAKQSKQNWENLAYRALLPKMREEVKRAYDEKHPWTPDNTLMIVMNEVLDTNGRY